MEEVNDVQALESISNEIDESQIKVILSSQCIKAQAFLLDNLKKQCKRHKETCSFISSANLKVETEIKHAEQEINRPSFEMKNYYVILNNLLPVDEQALRDMLIAQDTIKSANVEIRKELLLTKNRKADIITRVTDGKNKYEALWLECKTRYESIPFVQKLQQATAKQRTTDEAIRIMDDEMAKLYDDIETRRKTCADLDKKRCIELANFMVIERPTAINLIRQRSKQIKDLTNENEHLLQKEETLEVTVTAEADTPSNVIQNINSDKSSNVDSHDTRKNDNDPLIPELNLINFDLDIMDVSLDQVKIQKDEIFKETPMGTNLINYDFNKNVEKDLQNDKTNVFLSIPYFYNYNNEKPRNFSERKLINILEDININNNEVYNIVQKVNPEQLKAVDEISGEAKDNVEKAQKKTKDKEDKTIISQEIEEVDLTSSQCVENIIIPPTQFLDFTFLDDTNKKVSFDLSSSIKINEIIEKQDCEELSKSGNQTMNSQLDVSMASDESLMKIKDTMLKKRNLDLSPEFVYAKTNILQKTENDKIVVSKFFQNPNDEQKTNQVIPDEMEIEEEPSTEETNKSQDREAKSQTDLDKNDLAMDVDSFVTCSKENQVYQKSSEEQKSDAPVSGLLFTHGPQGIPDSLNVSLSTTGYEDSDFPHCIDSNLLLSPKADMCDMPNNLNSQETYSQEVPNFLSGFRKTGLSIFGSSSTSAKPKPDSSDNNEGNSFSFNFGGEKKNRGGLFSLFQ